MLPSWGSTGLLLFTIILTPVTPKYSNGIIDTKKNWNFLDRFCFVSEIGQIWYEFKYPKDYEVEKLYLYYDSPSQWKAVYKSGKTCKEKESVLHRDDYQIINMSSAQDDDFSQSGCEDQKIDGKSWIVCRGSRRFRTYRDRWWYLALGNCEENRSTEGLYLDYKLWMTNGDSDHFWFRQFSADEFYILQTDIGFLILEGLVFVVAIAVGLILRSRQMLHITYKMFLASMILEVASLGCDVIAYCTYARDGVGNKFMMLLGGISRCASVLVFVLLLILVGKGYTITRARLSTKSFWRILFFMSIYTFTYAALFIYQIRIFDPAEVLYKYESPAGYGLMILRAVGCIWLWYAIYFTLVNYPEKRGFYLLFTVAYSIWFAAGPILIVSCNFLLPNYMRQKVANGLEDGIAFLGFAFFIFLTRPSAANRNFPFHVRTTQIDILKMTKDDLDSVNLPHHTYEMRAVGKDGDVFTVSGMPSIDHFDKNNSVMSVGDSLKLQLGEEDDVLDPPPYDDVIGDSGKQPLTARA